jgi:hypothetical protein
MPIRAYVLVTTNPGKARDIAKAIGMMDGIKSADLTTGRFEVVVCVEKDLGSLDFQKQLDWIQGIVLKMRQEQGVRTETLMSTEKIK